MHQITTKRHWTLQGQTYPIYMLLMSQSLKFHPIFLYNHEHLTVKSTLYKLNIYQQRPKFSSVRLCNRPFSKYKVAENCKFRKCTESPQTDFEILTVKRTSYTLNATEGQIWVRFALRTIFKTQGYRKSEKLEMHQMNSKWSWTRNSRKYSIYTKYWPLRPKCWSVSLYD